MIFVSLDGDVTNTHSIIDKLKRLRPAYKIGLRAIYRGDGMALARDLKRMGHRIFLDAKLHDVGFTIEAALREIVESCKPDFVSVVTSNTITLETIKNLGTTVLPVLTLTSDPSDSQFKRTLGAAGLANMTGVICPVDRVRDVPNLFKHVVTPGIGPQGETATRAREAGATSIVVGRAITQANDPAKAYKDIAEEFYSSLTMRV
jgi:orotidine-5'-phosphate decarboxylase